MTELVQFRLYDGVSVLLQSPESDFKRPGRPVNDGTLEPSLQAVLRVRQRVSESLRQCLLSDTLTSESEFGVSGEPNKWFFAQLETATNTGVTVSGDRPCSG